MAGKNVPLLKLKTQCAAVTMIVGATSEPPQISRSRAFPTGNKAGLRVTAACHGHSAIVVGLPPTIRGCRSFERGAWRSPDGPPLGTSARNTPGASLGPGSYRPAARAEPAGGMRSNAASAAPAAGKSRHFRLRNAPRPMLFIPTSTVADQAARIIAPHYGLA